MTRFFSSQILSIFVVFVSLSSYAFGADTVTATNTATSDPQVLEWDDLVPADYDPEQIVEEYRRKYNIDELPDDDPILVELIQKLKILDKNAPLKETLNGKPVKIAGYVVPLQGDGQKTTEFLLVPYFGACIHVPPPPSNQTIYVSTIDKNGADIRKLYDVVWVTGIIRTQRFSSELADAGYMIEAQSIEPYL